MHILNRSHYFKCILNISGSLQLFHNLRTTVMLTHSNTAIEWIILPTLHLFSFLYCLVFHLNCKLLFNDWFEFSTFFFLLIVHLL
jgi:hypothetical protein